MQVGGVDSTDGMLVGRPTPAWRDRCCAGSTAGGHSARCSADAAPGRARPRRGRRRCSTGCAAPGCWSTSTPPTCSPPTPGPQPRPAPPRSSPRRRRAAVPGGRGGAAAVVVEGATRVGAPLAAVLAASGVGRVSVRDAGARRGRRRRRRRARPPPTRAGRARWPPPTPSAGPARSPTCGRCPPGARADLVVLARPWAASDPLVAGLPPRPACRTWSRPCAGETGVVGPAGRARAHRLPALRRPAPPGRRPALAAARRPAHRRRAAAQRRDRHLPAHRRRGRRAGARLPRRHGGPGDRWTRRSSCARPTCSPAAALAAAPRVRLRTAGSVGRSTTRRATMAPSGADASTGNNGRLTEPTSSPRRHGAATRGGSAGEEDA